MREEKSVAIEGENARAVWSPDTKTVAVLVSLDLFSCLLDCFVLIENYLVCHVAILNLLLLIMILDYFN